VFAVTFSVVFAYVADVTDETDRSAAYGLVSATFAASLVTSPALGAYLEQMYSEEVVVAVATGVAILDVLFIIIGMYQYAQSVHAIICSVLTQPLATLLHCY
jgi:predicted MFS family arabinose efflux permease